MEATVWFDNGRINKKRSHLQLLCSSQPLLRFRPSFTERSWATDPFVLFQNSIRHEIQDLYIMLRSASFRIDAMKLSDSLALQKWLVEFGQMVSIYFLVQENVIYPAVLRRQKSTTFSVTDLRSETTPLIGDLLEVHKESLAFVTACRNRDDTKLLNFDNDTLHQSLQRLSQLVFRLVSHIEDLFSWELENVASIVRERMSREEARQLERRSVLELVSYDVGENIFGGYAQWIPPHLKEQYLKGTDMLKMTRLRLKEKKWFKTHKALQMHFAKRY